MTLACIVSAGATGQTTEACLAQPNAGASGCWRFARH